MKFTSLSLKQCSQWLDRSDTDFVFDAQNMELVYWNSNSTLRGLKKEIREELVRMFQHYDSAAVSPAKPRRIAKKKTTSLQLEILNPRNSKPMVFHLKKCGDSPGKNLYAGFFQSAAPRNESESNQSRIEVPEPKS